MIGQKSGGWLAGGLVVAGWGWIAGTSTVDAGESRAKVAMTSSLASAPDEIRQRAFDGHDDTAFGSKEPAKDGDHLTLTFDAPAVIKSIAVETGRAGGGDVLDGGVLEVSEDGTKFEPVATFDLKGSARSEIPDKPLRSIRVRVQRDLGHPWWSASSQSRRTGSSRSSTRSSSPSPCEDAPELQPLDRGHRPALRAVVRRPRAEDSSENFRPDRAGRPDHATELPGGGRRGNGRITGSVRYFETHRDDQGAFIHETVHIIQNYPGHAGTPAGWSRGWPTRSGSSSTSRARRAGSTRTGQVRRQLPDHRRLPRLPQPDPRQGDRPQAEPGDAGRHLRQGDLRAALTGKPVEALDADWRASLPR